MSQPTHYDRDGDPVFPRIPPPGRGWDRCEECSRTGVVWSWHDNATREPVDDHQGAYLVVKADVFCAGAGWLPPAPARPRRKTRPGPDWWLCDMCDGRGGYYAEDDETPMNGKPRWYWQKCEDCCVDPDDDRDGLGWWPPEIGTDADQDEQVRLAQLRLYG